MDRSNTGTSTPTNALSKIESLALLSASDRAKLFSELDEETAESILWDWRWNGRPNQILPGTRGASESRNDWLLWLVLAGRGFGKTRCGAETVREWAEDPKARILMIAPTVADVRDVMIEGPSGLLSCYPASRRPAFTSSRHLVEFPSGAVGITRSADEPERLRGPQFNKFWCLTGDALVSMGDGSRKPLKEIARGDVVMTRKGPRNVSGHALTRRNAEVLRLKTVGGQIIIGTADHPVWIEGRGFTPLGSIQKGDSVCVISAWGGAAIYGTATETGSTTTARSGFTSLSGKRSMARCLTGFIYTIKTKTRQTTLSRTSNASRLPTTPYGTSKHLRHSENRAGLTDLPPGCATALRGYDENSHVFSVALLIQAGLNIRRDSVPLRVSIRPAAVHLLATRASVSIAGRHTMPPGAFSVIAPKHVTAGRAWRGLERYNLDQSPVLIAERHSQALASMPDSVRVNAPLTFTMLIDSVERLAEKADVYDIAVEDAGEFFANGILVHNCDELCAFQYPEQAWDQIMFGFRVITPELRGIITTTPKPIKTLKEIVAAEDTVVTRGSSYENRANISERYYSKVITPYEGTRLGRQEIYAQILEDVPGALWTRSLIEATRIHAEQIRWDRIVRTIVAIDPAVSHREDSDETGIGVLALTDTMHVLVMKDLSCIETPLGWGKVAVAAYRYHQADRVIGERNNGGDLIEANLRNIDPSIPYKSVWASKGKYIRAEPVSALYEQGRVHHVGILEKLEDQLCEWTPQSTEPSPNRLDWLVWGVTELLIDNSDAEMRVQFAQPYRITI